MYKTKLFFLACLITLLNGCGSVDEGPAKYQVSGVISFDGKPVEEGQILFIPEADNSQRQAGVIKNGSYSCECTTGKKKVEITAYRFDESKQEPDPAEPGKTVPARVQYIPKKYNQKTTLTAAVSAEGDNQFAFELSP